MGKQNQSFHNKTAQIKYPVFHRLYHQGMQQIEHKDSTHVKLCQRKCPKNQDVTFWKSHFISLRSQSNNTLKLKNNTRRKSSYITKTMLNFEPAETISSIESLQLSTSLCALKTVKQKLDSLIPIPIKEPLFQNIKENEHRQHHEQTKNSNDIQESNQHSQTSFSPQVKHQKQQESIENCMEHSTEKFQENNQSNLAFEAVFRSLSMTNNIK